MLHKSNVSLFFYVGDTQSPSKPNSTGVKRSSRLLSRTTPQTDSSEEQEILTEEDDVSSGKEMDATYTANMSLDVLAQVATETLEREPARTVLSSKKVCCKWGII